MPQPPNHKHALVDLAIAQFPTVVRNPDLQQILRELNDLDMRLLRLADAADPVPPEIRDPALAAIAGLREAIDSTDNQLKLALILKELARGLLSWSQSFALLYALAQPLGGGEPK